MATAYTHDYRMFIVTSCPLSHNVHGYSIYPWLPHVYGYIMPIVP